MVFFAFHSPLDHRLINAFLILNGVNTLLRVVSSYLDDKEVVNKSFPGFWQVLKRLGAK